MIVAGFAAFFGGILFLLGLLGLWLCGLASALCLMVAVFAGVMYGITGVRHDAELAIVYLVYASVPFMMTFVVSYYWSKFSEGRRLRHAFRTSRQVAARSGCQPRAERHPLMTALPFCLGVPTTITSSRRRVSPSHCYVAMPILPSYSKIIFA